MATVELKVEIYAVPGRESFDCIHSADGVAEYCGTLANQHSLEVWRNLGQEHQFSILTSESHAHHARDRRASKRAEDLVQTLTQTVKVPE